MKFKKKTVQKFFSVKKQYAQKQEVFFVEWNFILIPLGTHSNTGVSGDERS